MHSVADFTQNSKNCKANKNSSYIHTEDTTNCRSFQTQTGAHLFHMKWFKNLLDLTVLKVIFINTARRPTKTAAAFHVLGYRPTHLLHCRLRTALQS